MTVSTTHDGSEVALPELAVPEYILDHDDPAALFSRLQRVVIHLELLQQEAVADFDISFRDFVILATLRKEPAPHELAVTTIARYVLRPMGSISQGLDRVERAGLVERRPASDDRRRVLVRLTEQGARFADDVLAAYDRTRKRVFDRLDDEQLERIDSAVTDLLAALDQNYLEPGAPAR
ncbi:MAG: MarR family transcriptional regulator [Microthrixaceae bacterium]|nr:MarR family transcriptional regulator [Microthrixaceae bacterium]MCO5318919.1 MarR family transcriptional regulator [Microthrixaceae bacterium]